MRKALLSCGFILLIALGCYNSNTNNTSNSNNKNGSDKPDIPKSKGDFSTPKAAVETFIAAAENKDLDLLSKCFDVESPGEFRRYREKTATQKDLDSLANFAQGATVKDVEERGNSAMVRVKFKQRDEEIEMKKSSDGWKILDF